MQGTNKSERMELLLGISVVNLLLHLEGTSNNEIVFQFYYGTIHNKCNQKDKLSSNESISEILVENINNSKLYYLDDKLWRGKEGNENLN